MYTAFTVMGDVYAKIFWVADERMSGKVGGHGALCEASHAMPVMRSKPRDARYAKHEWARVGCRAYAAPSKR
jgi:hypothetical protein